MYEKAMRDDLAMVEALQTADAQEQVVARAEEVFPERLQHEVDVILSGIVGTGR